MSAPVTIFSGAPVAQIECATGEFALRINPAAQKCATAVLLVAQQQQAGFFHTGQIRAQQAFAAMQQFPRKFTLRR